MPKLIYIDINADIQTKQYITWKNKMIRRDWNFQESATWTRKGYGKKMKNSNIDIIISQYIPENEIKITFLDQWQSISDHKPILI